MKRTSINSVTESVAGGCLLIAVGLLFFFSGSILGISGFINFLPLSILGLILVVVGIFIVVGGMKGKREKSSSHYQVMPPLVDKKRSSNIVDSPAGGLSHQQESRPIHTPIPNPPVNNWALASFILSLLSPCGGIITGIPAIITGIIALRNIGKTERQTRNKGLAWTGIVLGSIISALTTCFVLAALLPDMSTRLGSTRTPTPQPVTRGTWINNDEWKIAVTAAYIADEARLGRTAVGTFVAIAPRDHTFIAVIVDTICLVDLADKCLDSYVANRMPILLYTPDRKAIPIEHMACESHGQGAQHRFYFQIEESEFESYGPQSFTFRFDGLPLVLLDFVVR